MFCKSIYKYAFYQSSERKSKNIEINNMYGNNASASIHKAISTVNIKPWIIIYNPQKIILPSRLLFLSLHQI